MRVSERMPHGIGQAGRGIGCTGGVRMGKRIKSWQDITVRAYVQGANGELIDVDTLSDEQKVDVATRLKCGWLNGMFDGKATFAPK